MKQHAKFIICLLMSFALNWTDADAQSNVSDSTAIILPKTIWYNASNQTYFAIPDSFARKLLRDAMVSDTLQVLYEDEVRKVADLRKNNREMETTLLRDRVVFMIVIFLLIVK